LTDTLGWFAASGSIALVVAVIARRYNVGFALPVMAVGALVGSVPIGPSAPLHPEVTLIAVLAPLVFGEALGSSYLDIRRVSRPVLALAVGLVLVTTVTIGLVVSWAASVPLALGFALGAILAPTDAVAVATIARKAALPRRLVSILEGESLVNDGTGLTALRVAVIAGSAGSIALWQVGVVLLLSIVGGVLVGLLGGWFLARVMAASRDVVAANALLLIAPFVVYLVAESIEGSGILAVVIAALYAAHAQTSDPRQTGRLHSGIVWRQVTFMLQAFAFFVVGLEIPDTFMRLSPEQIRLVVIVILGVVLLLIVTRMAFIMASIHLSKSWRAARDYRLAFLAGWAGARGPVSGMAALSIPVTLQEGTFNTYRDVLLATTFGVIVVSMLLAQTLGPLARWLGVQQEDERGSIVRIKGALAHAALKQLEEAEQEATMAGRPIPESVIAPLEALVEARLEALRAEGSGVAGPSADGSPADGSMGDGPDDGRANASARVGLDAAAARRMGFDLQVLMVRAEQEELVRMRDEEGIPDAIIRPMLADLDARLHGLSAGRGG